MNKILLILLSSFVLFSCNEEKPETPQVEISEEIKEVCMFSINNEEQNFEWTAFKTTEKIGVKGTFDSILITNNKKEAQIADLLINTEFRIDLNSVNSANPERDKKLITYFFGNLTNSSIIKGMVKEANGENAEGEAIILLAMNSVYKNVTMHYTFDGNKLNLSGKLDLLDWETTSSLDALHTECKELHTGEDGISKTWSEINIEASTTINKVCK